MTPRAFQKIIYDAYNASPRDLPWRKTTNPYCILVSEIMLQQTQALRVIPKYKAFLQRFPTVNHLACASTHEVLQMWQGLGYNHRALRLQQAAQKVVTDYKGKFPKTYESLLALPGVGPYTASAVCTFAYDMPIVMIETNIRAVFIHFFFSEAKEVPDSMLLPFIEKYCDTKNPRRWYNALMDYGAMLKATVPNPSRKSKHHVQQSKFQGSIRQVRGAIIKAYTAQPRISLSMLTKQLPYSKDLVQVQYKKLKGEGFFR